MTLKTYVRIRRMAVCPSFRKGSSARRGPRQRELSPAFVDPVAVVAVFIAVGCFPKVKDIVTADHGILDGSLKSETMVLCQGGVDDKATLQAGGCAKAAWTKADSERQAKKARATRKGRPGPNAYTINTY